MDDIYMIETQNNIQKPELRISILRLYADESGKSHFGNIDLNTSLVDFAFPAPKVYLSSPNSANTSFFLVIPAKWFGDYHPVPSRQIMTLISGSLEVQVSDGTRQTFKAGQTALVEDTFGDGHITKNNSTKVAILLVIQL